MDVTNWEWALLICITIPILLFFRFLIPLLKLVFNPRNFVKLYLPIIIFCGLMFFVLSRFGIWDDGKLKISMIWFCSVGLIFPLRMVINSKDESKNIMISDLIFQNFTFAAFLELLLTAYSFNLILSILYIGFLSFLTIFRVIAEQHKNSTFVKWIDIILLCFVAAAFVPLIQGLRTHPKEFFKADTVVDYLFPVFLSLIYTPFAWTYSSIVICEDKLVRLRHYIPDASLRRYAKMQAMFEFSMDHDTLVRWMLEVKRKRVFNKQEVLASIARVASMIVREKTPPKINKSLGWSPYEAKDFLKSQDLQTGYYQQVHDGWIANGMLNLGKKYGKSNKIHFSVQGDKDLANCLELRISIDLLVHKKKDLDRFMGLCTSLTLEALGISLPEGLRHNINKPIGFEFVQHDAKIQFSKTFNDFGDSRSLDATFRILHLNSLSPQ